MAAVTPFTLSISRIQVKVNLQQVMFVYVTAALQLSHSQHDLHP